MKYQILGVVLASVISGLFGLKIGEHAAAKPAEEVAGEEVLRHVVLFKFKDDASAEDVQGVEEAFAALPGKIEEIRDFEWGTNNSPEGLDQGFTHCFFLTFHSEEDRATYLPHPDHKLFGKALGPHLDKVLVVDYWSK
ncbi:MAG: Dabb family protein [Saprospiraceae bacterium]|nr:Dabb family protein [Saprospiraceae bacterium]